MSHATQLFGPASSTSGNPRPLKRRLTPTEIPFLTTAAESFRPLPYKPNNAVAEKPAALKPAMLAAFAASPPPMDPSPDDPYAVFIRPPFDDFPNAHLYTDGLSYAVMALNPEWFLVAQDFITMNSSNPNGIPYPPQLEPPRGWCPTKKKDLKNRVESWPEGEEPRLRCTFCRRTYAGVNAKSMWRRHVFEKHKVAMSNRRDNCFGRTPGRTSIKANKQQAAVSSKENSDIRKGQIDVVASNTVGLAEIKPMPNRKSRNFPPTDGACAKAALTARVERSREKFMLPATQAMVQKEFGLGSDDFEKDYCLRSAAPMDTLSIPPESLHTLNEDGKANAAGNLSPTPALSGSPYDPLSTPAFHHSPGRLSTDPWRFPSPSHPLHSKARDLSLSMVAQGAVTPNSKGMVSPSTLSIMNISPFFSPSFKSGASPRFTFNSNSKKQTSLSETDRMARLMIEDSPLGRARFDLMDWMSRSQSSPGLNRSGLAGLADPFAEVFFSWTDNSTDHSDSFESPASTPEAESPVLRSAALPDFGPLIDKSDCSSLGSSEDIFGGLKFATLGDDEDDEAEVEFALSAAFRTTREASPLRKRRRT